MVPRPAKLRAHRRRRRHRRRLPPRRALDLISTVVQAFASEVNTWLQFHWSKALFHICPPSVLVLTLCKVNEFHCNYAYCYYHYHNYLVRNQVKGSWNVSHMTTYIMILKNATWFGFSLFSVFLGYFQRMYISFVLRYLFQLINMVHKIFIRLSICLFSVGHCPHLRSIEVRGPPVRVTVVESPLLGETLSSLPQGSLVLAQDSPSIRGTMTSLQIMQMLTNTYF